MVAKKVVAAVALIALIMAAAVLAGCGSGSAPAAGPKFMFFEMDG